MKHYLNPETRIPIDEAMKYFSNSKPDLLTVGELEFYNDGLLLGFIIEKVDNIYIKQNLIIIFRRLQSKLAKRMALSKGDIQGYVYIRDTFSEDNRLSEAFELYCKDFLMYCEKGIYKLNYFQLQKIRETLG
jgi:hypothetical protein